MMTEKRDDIEKIWDRADFAADSAWNEMDSFLKSVKPPKSEEEKEKLGAEFKAIMQRANTKALDIFNRASSGNKSPHLTEIKRDP